jgi:hypothetical protein
MARRQCPEDDIVQMFSKKIKNTLGGLTGTPLGILRYKCGMLLFLLFTGSESCKFEKMARRQCSEDYIGSDAG